MQLLLHPHNITYHIILNWVTGPIVSTIEDLWQMVWQEDVYVIAMVTNLSEGGTVWFFLESKSLSLFSLF